MHGSADRDLSTGESGDDTGFTAHRRRRPISRATWGASGRRVHDGVDLQTVPSRNVMLRTVPSAAVPISQTADP